MGHSKSFSDHNASFDPTATAISTNYHSQKSSFEVNTLKMLKLVKALHTDRTYRKLNFGLSSSG